MNDFFDRAVNDKRGGFQIRRFNLILPDFPFDPAMLVYFRKRLGIDVIKRVNELICKMERKEISKGNKDYGENSKESPEDNKGGKEKPEEIKEN
jgi:hypothetical protein